ncbi:DUF2147 domain-containing protein [Sphingomonas turrisvirgatae]|uniref:DUF2147 domain-containing protein n=1 Tax=Sphingomonas turrisvirgatae TaxID=1888892 RepID=A0A1E3LQQ8_9SPHN|nr:DUF2147 domain-containing protein [Sphingomonas turrisvirgatae]ODP36087.1 hypothetical protein BFL28_07560 [Sphingomonas turrisvirgatae]
MKGKAMLAAFAAAMTMLAPAAYAGGDAGPASGSAWRNPSNSVHIRLTPCGADRMCGTVIWASDKAKADARRGGTDQLIGANLFHEFRRVAPDEYKGRVFVPDINRTFSGQMKVQGDSLIGKGCVLAGLICKQQVWKRIS